MAFLVLTSGLDNMILVLRAISQTDLNLPVPERMAVGLKQVGVEMTVLLMVEELIAAWLLWFVEITVRFISLCVVSFQVRFTPLSALLDEGVLALMRHAPPCFFFSLLHPPLLSRGLSQDNTSRWMILPSKSRLVSFYAAKKIPRDK